MKPQLMQRYSGSYQTNYYYRIRSNPPAVLDRKSLFHIPYNDNHLIGTERYSMPGYPCLYLASHAVLAWYECGKPQKFGIAKFYIPHEEENRFKFIDFSEKLLPLQNSFSNWFHNEEDKQAVRNYLLKYIYTYPLRAACSVVVEHQGAKFIEEYIVPQLLLQWVRNDDDFDGIRYESCSGLDEVRGLGGHNIVLITKQFDRDGYDVKLRNCIKLGWPERYDLSTWANCKEQVDGLQGEEQLSNPFLWGMSNISDDFCQI